MAAKAAKGSKTAPRSQAYSAAGLITIEIPTSPPAMNPVRVQGTNTAGFICARGTCVPDGQGQPSDNVYGMIINGGGDPPLIPPVGATRGKLVSANIWSIARGCPAPAGQDIPNANCGPPNAPALNTLVVWIRYTDNVYRIAGTDFNGTCAPDTFCGDMC